MPRTSLVLASSFAALLVGCDATGEGGEGGGGGGGAGGTVVSTEATFGRGTRLVPRVVDAGDGAVVWRDFFDTELGVACTFEDTADGLRCVPRGLVQTFPGGMFLDGSCAEPAVEVNTCNDQPLAPLYDLSDTCRGPVAVEVFAGGGETVSAVGSIEAHGNCSEGAEVLTLRPATRLPLDRLVAGAIEVVPVDGDLGVRRLVGADGSFATLGLTRAGNACTPTEVDGVVRCVDDHVALSAAFDGAPPRYADAACSVEAAMVDHPPGCTPPLPALAIRGIADELGCVEDRRYHAVDGAVDGIHLDISGSCEVGYSENQLLVRLGDELPPAALPEVETVRSGTGRLQAAVRTSGGEVVFGDPLAFHDTELDVACRPLPAGDGLRCIPAASIELVGTYDVFFADECGEALYPTPRSAVGGCAEVPRFTAVTSVETCGDLVGSVLERGALHEGPVWIHDAEVGCMPVPNPGNLYQVAARHSVTAFAALDVRVLE